MKSVVRSLLAVGLVLVSSGRSFAADEKNSSSALRADKTYSLGLIDGPRVDGGAILSYSMNADTILEVSYLEEKNLCIGDAKSSEYNSKSKSVDLGVKRFFGNSLFTSLSVRHMETESTNNNYIAPQILLWQNDIMGRLAIGNQWQFIEGLSLGVEWLSVGATVHRINHSSKVQSTREADFIQAIRDEKKANRFFYSSMNVLLGYSF